MKKLLSLLLVISVVMTVLVIPVASADVEDPYAIDIPASWELIGEESFLREPIDDGEGNVTSKFGISTFASDSLEFVETTAYEDETKGYTQDDFAYMDGTNGLVLAMPKAKTNNSATFKMKTAMDFSTDNDYYLIYEINPRKSNNSSVSVRLWNSNNYEVTTSGAYSISSGLSSNNSPFTHTCSLYREYLKSDGSVATGNIDSWTNREYNYDRFNNRWFKRVMQISPRQNGYTLIRERWFDMEDETAEKPSLAPLYWNNATYLDTKTYIGDSVDTLRFMASHNSGSTLNLMIRNLEVYKASALNSYTTPAIKPDGNTALKVSQTQTDAVVSTDNAPYTMTMDTVPEGIELVSQGWYDYSDEANPVLIADGASITVPASMKGKLLKAKLVVKENGAENTYYPFNGIVRDIVDLYSNVNNNVLNTNAFTAKVTYYKTNSDGSLATKTTQTSNNSGSAALTYVDWTNATRVDFTGQFNVNSSVSTDDGLISIIFAHYDKEGVLKNVIKANPENTAYQNGPGRIGSYTPKTVQTYNAKIIDGTNYDFSTIESGDYFKCFLWKTTSTPTAVNKKYYYNFEQLIPLDYNPNTDRVKADYSAPVVTVPMPVEE